MAKPGCQKGGAIENSLNLQFPLPGKTAANNEHKLQSIL